MRSYNQFCALARALDIAGDRWSLLIVRELLARGPLRYTDLQHGLPGIATNMLAGRLRQLVKAGVVREAYVGAPVATTLFSLTEWGAALRPALLELGRWARPLMARRRSRDAVRGHWLAIPVEGYLTDGAPERPPVVIAIETGSEPMLVHVGGGEVRVRPGTHDAADLTLNGPFEMVVALLMGRIDVATARARKVSARGDTTVLRRLRPAA